MAGRIVAAHLDGRLAVFVRRIGFALAAAVHKMVRGIPAVEAGVVEKIVAARRLEPRGLHCGFLLGVETDRRFARRALPRRVASVGFALGRTSKKKLVERAALHRSVFGGGGRAGVVLAGVDDGKANESGR